MKAGWGTIILVVIVGAIWYGAHKTHQTNNHVQQNYSSIYMGESIANVEAELGQPDSQSSSTSSVLGSIETLVTMTYGTYGFVFENGKLTSKSHY